MRVSALLSITLLLSACSSTTSPPNAVVIPVTPCHRQPLNPPLADHPAYGALASLDPSARATQIAGSPQLGPPSRQPRYISRQRAIEMARQAGASEYSSAAPLSAPITARLMTIRRFDAILGEGWDYAVNPRRKLWIVTVHSRWVNTEAARPAILGVFTIVIDGESGKQFMGAAGCDPFATRSRP